MKLLSLVLAIVSFWAALSFGQPTVMAKAPITKDIQLGLCAGSNLDFTGKCVIYKPSASDYLTSVTRDIINILSIIVGVVAVIMIIVGGFRYITSGGSDTSVTGAKNTILYAIIGLVIVALAQVIVHFVLRNVSGV